MTKNSHELNCHQWNFSNHHEFEDQVRFWRSRYRYAIKWPGSAILLTIIFRYVVHLGQDRCKIKQQNLNTLYRYHTGTLKKNFFLNKTHNTVCICQSIVLKNKSERPGGETCHRIMQRGIHPSSTYGQSTIQTRVVESGSYRRILCWSGSLIIL